MWNKFNRKYAMNKFGHASNWCIFSSLTRASTRAHVVPQQSRAETGFWVLHQAATQTRPHVRWANVAISVSELLPNQRTSLSRQKRKVRQQNALLLTSQPTQIWQNLRMSLAWHTHQCNERRTETVVSLWLVLSPYFGVCVCVCVCVLRIHTHHHTWFYAPSKKAVIHA